MESVLAVLVLYRTKLEDSKSFVSLTNSLKSSAIKMSLFVYDNSPIPNNPINSYPEWDINYIHDPSNSGLGKAYNQGHKFALQLGKSWLLLLDQDTDFDKNAISIYSKNITDRPENWIQAPIVRAGNLILSPYKSWYGHGVALKTIAPGTYTLNKYKVINSGMMIHTELFNKCKGYNENIKLDFSDLSFLLVAEKYLDELCILEMECEQQFFHLSNNNEQRMIERFRGYCNDLNGIYKQTKKPMYKLMGMLRAVKLVIRQRRMQYLMDFYRLCIK